MGQALLVCPKTSDTGAYRLSWGGTSSGEVFRLTENGQTIYEGTDLATTVTGRASGLYEYRVEAVEAGLGASAAPPCTVRVEPPALSTAFTFLAAGFLVFAATTAVVVRGHRAHRSGEIG